MALVQMLVRLVVPVMPGLTVMQVLPARRVQAQLLVTQGLSTLAALAILVL
jgi:hypothetical protein